MQSKEYLISDSVVRHVISAFWEVRRFLSKEDVKAADDSNAERWNELSELRTTIYLALDRFETEVKRAEVAKQREAEHPLNLQPPYQRERSPEEIAKMPTDT
jgi:hypothetical protein